MSAARDAEGATNRRGHGQICLQGSRVVYQTATGVGWLCGAWIRCDKPLSKSIDQVRNGTVAYIVGDANAKTGIHALLDAGTILGVVPRLICAPGFTAMRFGGIDHFAGLHGGENYVAAPKVTVDKIEMGAARVHDSRGRALPVWQGCRVIADGAVFLMNWQSADSFDGRYFGVLPTSAIIGTAEPLWTGEEE